LLACVGLLLVSLVRISQLAHVTLSHEVMIVNLICLSAKAVAGRRPASFVLKGFEPASGWTPGWSFVLLHWSAPGRRFSVESIPSKLKRVPDMNV